jgi:CelD/BcsL family acetyltransferase involved in cellulose biosynthesis
VVDTTADWQTYWKGLSAKLRKTLNAQDRQLRARGRLAWQDAAQAERWADWLEAWLLLEAAGWKGMGGSAILHRPEEARFYRHVIKAAVHKRRLHLFVLTLDDRLIAAHLMLAENGMLHWLKTAYDETLAHYGPGALLLRFALQECFADPSALMVSSGSAAWTARWATRFESLMRVRIAPARSVAGAWLRARMHGKRLWTRLMDGRHVRLAMVAEARMNWGAAP